MRRVFLGHFLISLACGDDGATTRRGADARVDDARAGDASGRDVSERDESNDDAASGDAAANDVSSTDAVEHRIVMNTPGEHDGIVQGWYNGVFALFSDESIAH